MVFPCPGDKACMAPRPKATRRPNRIDPQPNFLSRSITDRKSPRITDPGPADCRSAKLAAGAATTGEGISGAGVCFAVRETSTCFVAGCGMSIFRACTGGVFADHRTDAARSCGGASVGSAGYEVSSWLVSASKDFAPDRAIPSPPRTTISFQPVRFA